MSAFSLIELSIVIIILGLLAVGVMGGMGMVRTAKSNNILVEYRNIKAATNSFLLYRNRLPGDTNRDDVIDNYTITAEGVSESLYFWRELLEENLIGSLRYNMPEDIISEKNIIVGTTIPSSRYDKTVGWHKEYSSDIKSNRILLTSFDINGKPLSVIPSEYVKNIDIKIDDGNIFEGIVGGEGDCTSKNNYDSIGKEEKCILAFYSEGVKNRESVLGYVEVKYGAGTKWAIKSFVKNTLVSCSNDTFGDPFLSTVKACYIKDVKVAEENGSFIAK